jgi:hypothetical protein
MVVNNVPESTIGHLTIDQLSGVQMAENVYPNFGRQITDGWMFVANPPFGLVEVAKFGSQNGHNEQK